ncbi:MAG: hypothetical protein H7X92_02045 [Chitinophagales bacterium]|nr:hypothetical protein [Hyphomicrobiales bacterium]
MSNIVRGAFRTRAARQPAARRPASPAKIRAMIDDLIQALDASPRGHSRQSDCLGLPQGILPATRPAGGHGIHLGPPPRVALPERRTDTSPCLGLPRGILSQPFKKD